MYKTLYSSQFDALFIKIYDYEGSVVARACVEVMEKMQRTQVVSLAFVVVDLQEVSSASLRDSDAALQSRLFKQLEGLGADNSSIQLVLIFDPVNSNNEIVMDRLNRIKSMYGGMAEHTSVFLRGAMRWIKLVLHIIIYWITRIKERVSVL